jgi:hypothetical protein
MTDLNKKIKIKTKKHQKKDPIWIELSAEEDAHLGYEYGDQINVTFFDNGIMFYKKGHFATLEEEAVQNEPGAQAQLELEEKEEIDGSQHS